MYEYLLTGTNDRGRRKTVIAQAATAEEVIRRFESQGYSDIVLHTDELVAPFFNPSALVKQFRPAQIVYLRTTGPLAFSWVITKVLYGQLWFVALLAGGIIGFRRFQETPWGLWDLLPLLLVLTPAALGFYWGLTAFRRPERRLLMAVGWARWEEALGILKKGGLNIVPFEHHLRKSQALAGVGRLPEALMEYDKVRDIPGVTEHRYWAFQSVVYAAAGEPAKALSATMRAHEVEPSGTAVRIEYANKLLTTRRDIRGARILLSELDDRLVSDVVMPGLRATEAIIHLYEGETAKAVEMMREAVHRLSEFTRGNPLLLPICARVRAWFSMALAAKGDFPAARQQLRLAHPILFANQEVDLLRWCEQDILMGDPDFRVRF